MEAHVRKRRAEALGESIRELRRQIEGYENYQHTGNEFLDIIIRDKARTAQEKGIDFSAVIHFEDGNFIEPLDISTIFGNVLDNAIEASEKLPPEQRIITIKAKRIQDMLVIVCENNAARDSGAGEKTTKDDQFLHGFGIANIRRAVEKYSGECEIQNVGGRFVVKMVIPVE